jgi:hypothetical protein
MKVRGDEMFRDLYPRHLWDPYDSHNTRAWHFLGEVGIAFLDEVEGADEWTWFAANVFFNVYPSWSDDDGGWHQGISRLLRPPASHAAKDPNTVAGTQLLVQLLRPFVGFRHLPDERDGARIREG